MAAGSIAIFNFANNIQFLPVGLVGVSLATASFPVFSRTWADGKREEFLKNFYATFNKILILTIPLSVLMFLLRREIIQIIFKTGQFAAADVELTADVLGFFSLGIFAFASLPFLARIFYSFQDTKTPVAIGVISMILNIILAFWLAKPLGLKGLALAFSISGIFQFALLLIFLRKRFKIL